MNFIETLTQRNAEFAKDGYSAELNIIPSRKTMIIGCVDPRVDPMDVLKLEPGEAAIIRNVGGRVNPALFETLAVLRTVSRLGGSELGQGWNLVVLQHTECGIKGCYHNDPGLLAKYLGVPTEDLDALALNDPYEAVAIDVMALRANPDISAGFTVTGLVYDMATGLIETVVPTSLLRPE
jgi:carbonic anhydrase